MLYDAGLEHLSRTHICLAVNARHGEGTPVRRQQRRAPGETSRWDREPVPNSYKEGLE